MYDLLSGSSARRRDMSATLSRRRVRGKWSRSDLVHGWCMRRLAVCTTLGRRRMGRQRVNQSDELRRLRPNLWSPHISLRLAHYGLSRPRRLRRPTPRHRRPSHRRRIVKDILLRLLPTHGDSRILLLQRCWHRTRRGVDLIRILRSCCWGAWRGVDLVGRKPTLVCKELGL